MSDVRITVSERHGRQCASSGARWEPIVGYSRAVRAGNLVAVTGTVGINADGTYAPSVSEQRAGRSRSSARRSRRSARGSST